MLNDDNLSASNQKIDDTFTYKAWQPCNSYEAIEKLTNLLETDQSSNNE